MAYNELDKMKFEYTVPSVGNYQRIDPTEIYLAKPGKRVIGKLNGIDEDSCHIEINLQNTSVLELTVNRVLDGEVANFYDLIDQHYELFVKGFGWFKINEEPEMNNDGTLETKNIRAESLEIELQQFDLVNFHINTGEQWSREMMALDNTYEVVDEYTAPRDSVRFWRDLSGWDEFIAEFPDDGTAADLLTYLRDGNHNFLYESWRIIYDLDQFNNALKTAEAYYRSNGETAVADYLKDQVGQIETQAQAFNILRLYPKVRESLTAVDVDVSYTDEYGEEQEGSVKEVMIRERERMHDLSFLDLVLEETGWKVGFIDPLYKPTSEDASEREKLADRIGYFSVDSQDVYSFITQEAAQYFRCVFDFDTENCTVNAYKIETLGKDTNIFLNFHNIQNSVTRSSDRKYYTVYHVANGTGDDNIDITEANFGTDAIEDISYFLNTKHFPQSLIDKYLEWQEYRESERQNYMDLSVEYRDQVDVVQEINTRVPKDGANQRQYSSFTVEELEAERENYKAEKRGYEIIHVDNNNEFDLQDLMDSRDWPDYKMIIDVILSRPKTYTVDAETLLSLPTKALMVMEPDNAIYEKIMSAEEIKKKLKELPDRVEVLQDAVVDAETQVAEIEAEIGSAEPTEEQTAALNAAREQLASARNDLQTAQQEATDLPNELDGLEAQISAYYAEHETETLLDDDTIETVIMYCLYENHLGNIDTELYNRWLVKYKGIGEVIEKLEFDEDYMYDFATYGDSYGLAELKAQLKSLEDKVEAEKQYAGKAGQSDEYHRKHYKLYEKYLAAYNACKTVLDQRQQEYDDAEAELKRIADEMLDLRNSVDKKYWKDSNDNGFTDKELWLLQRYYINTDYTNDNIVVTDVFTNEQIVQTEYDLYKDALEQLYADSHPQWQYQTTQDNLLMMPELQDWHGELEIGNFIRVGFREDDPYYIHTYDAPNQVKLRLTAIGLNPFMIEPTIDLTFSTMIQYKSKRNDFVEIIGSASGGSGKNKITANYNGTKEGNINITSDFIAKLLNSGSFTNGVANAVIGNGGFVGAVGGAITDAINNMDISVDQIGDLTTKLSDLVNGYVDANVITTKLLYADTAHIREIQSKLITSDQIIAGIVNVDDPQDFSLLADSAFIQYLNTGVIETGTVSADQVIAALVRGEQGDFDELTADSAFISRILTVGEAGITQITEDAISTATINADQINTQGLTAQSTLVQDILTVGTDKITQIAGGTVTTERVVAALVDATDVQAQNVAAKLVTGDTIIAGLVDVEDADDFSLLADSAFVDYLESNLVIASEIQVDDLKAKLANISVADIDELSTNHAFINSLQTLSSTAATSVIDDAYIANAVVGKINVGQLAAGDITLSDSMRITSQNGQMIMNGQNLQIMGEDSNGDPYVGIQLGYGTNQNPSLILRNEEGATILTPQGITSDAIADGLIVNDMIGNNTIQKSKLGFSIVEPNAQGGVDITQIYDGEGNLWGQEYTTFKQGTQQALSDLAQDIQDSANYDLFIETPYGTNIWGGNIQLNVKLLKNNVDVTDEYDASCFIWTRTSRDHDADVNWNNNHSVGAKVITITANDVRINADFQCKFEYNNITVTAG